jgi:ribonucleoside-triphosphate reductase
MQPKVVQGSVSLHEFNDKLKQQFDSSKKHFSGPNSHAQLFQAFDKFARYIPEKKRRELWPETVDRVISFFRAHAESNAFKISSKTWDQLADGLLNLEASPSMRCVQMSGPALDRCHVGVYNCAFQFLRGPQDMAEELYILMQGTGVGFSVEYEESVKHWPRVQQQHNKEIAYHEISDTTEGWCDAYKLGLETWLAGGDIEFDFSLIRPEGTPLKIKGGRSSGPGPLRDLLRFTRQRILSRQDTCLTSLDLHDINCYAHRIVQMGGVRRASGISLSDLNDIDMQNSKVGEFWEANPQRNQANNSAVYRDKPDWEVWQSEWKAIHASGSGERGIFNRGSLKKQFPPRRTTEGHVFGTNPCGEIVLRHKQFCNLSIAVVRPDDSLEDIVNKVRLATIWGTLQSTMTKFEYLGPEWQKNSEEERLLGVDLLGFLDHPMLTGESSEEVLTYLRDIVKETNIYWAEILDINCSAALTCIKPSGDSSIFFDTAAGFKGHHGKHYIRRMRTSATNPVARMLRDAGVPCHDDYDNSGLLVLEFPMQSPENGVTLEEQTALGQLELWLRFKRSWTEHNPSVTIYIREDEWDIVSKWVYDHWDEVGGLSFLPYFGGVYPLAPYEAITEDEYTSRASEFPEIDWSQLMLYETEDMTELSQQYACTGDKCSI